MSTETNKETVRREIEHGYEMNGGKIQREVIPDLDLFELHRLLAALTNSHMHHDLRGIPEVERRAAIADVLEQIEEMLAFERMPWQTALEKASRKVDEKNTRSPRRAAI